MSGEGGIGFNRPIWHLLTKDLSTSKERSGGKIEYTPMGGRGGEGWQTGLPGTGEYALYIYSYIYKNCSV